MNARTDKCIKQRMNKRKNDRIDSKTSYKQTKRRTIPFFSINQATPHFPLLSPVISGDFPQRGRIIVFVSVAVVDKIVHFAVVLGIGLDHAFFAVLFVLVTLRHQRIPTSSSVLDVAARRRTSYDGKEGIFVRREMSVYQSGQMLNK